MLGPGSELGKAFLVMMQPIIPGKVLYIHQSWLVILRLKGLLNFM